MASGRAQKGEESCSVRMEVTVTPGSASSPQSEAVTNELQELTLQPAPKLPPIKDRKNVLQLKLQQRRTREELVSQGIMPPLKSPAAFHEQRRSLERARTEDYLKRKIRSRPERSELVRMHILEETSAEPSLQAKQLQLKRARLADDLNDKISHRPGPIELVHKNILPAPYPVHNELLDSPKGESSSLDEDSSDALSPDQLTNHDSPLSVLPQMSPSEAVSPCSRNLSPTQFLTQPSPPPPPPPPPPLPMSRSISPLSKVSTPVTSPTSRLSQVKSQTKSSSDRPPQRSKKAKDNKPKVKKLKYHQYIPPDQKADKERPPQMDSSYAKLLHQQQLFLQLQILNQQQQHYNYHTILPAPPKPSNEQPQTTSSGSSPACNITTTTSASSNHSPAMRSAQTHAPGAKPGALPLNLDEFKVAELKAELKLRGLTVSGTKNDLIERLRNYQEQNGPSAVKTCSQSSTSTPSSSSFSSHSLEPQLPTVSLPSMAHVQPHQIMRFGSTSSSPPVSPSPSERSLAAMSPDETSCSGDMFGEMVSSPLTQLSLHPSPQHPSSSLCQSVLSSLKEESQASCVLARLCASALPDLATEPASADKDLMLQEKDKQIEELTRMLRQKQQLVETLRSQLEQGKTVKKEDEEGKPACVQVKPQTLIKASAIQPPTLPNGALLRLKREEHEEKMEEEAKKATHPPQTQMQCSQETLLRLQQIQRLQAQQAEQLKVKAAAMVTQAKAAPIPTTQQQKKDPQLLLRQQQHIQQLIIQQTQQKQLQTQQKQLQTQQKQLQTQSKQVQQVPGPVQTQQQRSQLKQVQVHIQNQRAASGQHKRPHRVQQRPQSKQSTAPAPTQQVTSVVINQQNASQVQTQAISLDFLKTNGAPTLVTDSNGNHYLIAVTSNPGDGHTGLTSLAKSNGRITLQRLQSTPSKLPGSNSDSQSKEQPPMEPVKKVQKPALHLDVNLAPQPSHSVSAPPTSQPPFFEDLSDGESQNHITSSLKRELYDRHALFTPPSPKPNTSPRSPRPKENGVNSQQMDDLFDILLKSGEIPGFRSNPDPTLAPLHSDPPSPTSPPSPLRLSPPTPTASEPILCPTGRERSPCGGTGRLEDFLESTTGAPLMGGEGDCGLTLIDDLHSQMLSTPSILEHSASPMDTSDLGFSPHSAQLDFGDAALDSMDWLDISMVGSSSSSSGGSSGESREREGGTGAPLVSPHTPQSVFSVDFLDSTDLQLHWESCL
ncbi:unnamed protein product [Knipowitschia caucasica]